MMSHLFQVLFFGLSTLSAVTRPTPRGTSQLPTQPITPLTTQEIAALAPAAYLASAAYCPSNTITSWSCGIACGNVTQPTSITTGGNGADTPRFFVASNETTVVVAISGTNVSNLHSIDVDLKFALQQADSGLFPNAAEAEVHRGFQGALKRMIGTIGPAVQVQADGKNVFVTGHSLGGALSIMTAVHLQHLLPNVSVSSTVFAAPRVGNQAWANYVDATLGSNAQHVINLDDAVPHVPPRDWGYQQSSGEIWISSKDEQTYNACSGQENEACSDGSEDGALAAWHLLEGFVDDLQKEVHGGPYAGVTITAGNCS